MKDNVSLSKLDDDDTIIDRYQHRPQELESMCLAEFAATYVVNYERSDDNECQWRSQGGARGAIAPPFFKNNVIKTFVN